MKKGKCPKCDKKCAVLSDKKGIVSISCDKCGYFWGRDKKVHLGNYNEFFSITQK